MNKKQILQRQLNNLHGTLLRIQTAFLSLPKKHRAFNIGISSLILVLLFLPTGQELTLKNASTKGFEVGKRYQIALPEQPPTSSTNSTLEIKLPPTSDSNNNFHQGELEAETTINSEQHSKMTWQSVTVKNGDSLARIFKRLGFSAQDTYAISSAKGKESKLLLKMNVGDTLRIATNDDKKITALEYPLSKTETLYINLVGDSYQAYKESKMVEIREAFAHGIINTNFWNAGTTSGFFAFLFIELANIF